MTAFAVNGDVQFAPANGPKSEQWQARIVAHLWRADGNPSIQLQTVRRLIGKLVAILRYIAMQPKVSIEHIKPN